MLRTLQTARQSLHLEQARIDTLANNLANAATSGFRQVLTRVTEEAPPLSAEPLPPMQTEPADRELALSQAPAMARGSLEWTAPRPLLMSQALDMRAGTLAVTGRATDLALAGRGFFVVQDLEGTELYTRDGGFNLDATGGLVTASGLPVQGAGGPIQAGGGTLTIDGEGNVRVDGQERGRLRIVDFERPHELLPRGDGLLKAPPQAAPTDLPADEVAVAQGHLESSNVDPVRTLVDMIAAQRAFEIGAKVLQANDELLGQSVNTLGRNA